ncbi:MAG TPA: ABC transporter ATP-binding protein [Quisquiliibacterium sp.]|nr:ABC transporter ATP-binding protein [Quisquiliibacterium sp.]
MGTIVELAGVRKSYGVGTPVQAEVLHGIDLRLEEGEFVALVGPSGSGKSTLLNLIGLLERPTSGTLRIDGQDTAMLAEDALTELRGRSIGFVFQFHHLLPAFSALENVLMPAIIERGVAGAADLRRARELLARVGLADAERKRPSQLSGGMQQRVAVARALALSPRLILADEPTGNLDTRSANEIFELLLEFNRETGAACMIVTHDQGLAARCQRRIEIVDGRIAGGAASVTRDED